MNLKTFDVIIIGGGAAGISAALWCDELGLSSILLESGSELGGQLLWTYNAIENHLGIEAKNGVELRDIFVRQIKKRDFSLYLNAKVAEIDLKKKVVLLENKEGFSAKTLILATGIRRRTLGIEGERRFDNKGVLKSGKRDKDFVNGKRVLIIGGGDAALENCLILSETAKQVYLAHRRDEFRARAEFIESARKDKKIKFLQQTVLRKIEGGEKIESVELEDLTSNKTYRLPIDAVLFRIGVEPNSRMFDEQLRLNKEGYIKVDNFCATNIEGVFAIGDVANPVSPTISSAVGMGATAVKTIYHLLT